MTYKFVKCTVAIESVIGFQMVHKALQKIKNTIAQTYRGYFLYAILYMKSTVLQTHLVFERLR